MALLTLTLKNTTASPVTIADASAVIIPASGQDTFTDANMLLQLARSANLQAFVSAGTLVVNNGADLSVAVGLQYLAQVQSQGGYTALPMTITLYQMQLGSQLDGVTLPLVNCGIEIAQTTKTVTLMQGRRGTPGSAGTTTVQLEVNGSAIGGATLSWTPGDGAFALKTVAIVQAIVAGDRVSFRLTSAETGGEDVFVEVS